MKEQKDINKGFCSWRTRRNSRGVKKAVEKKGGVASAGRWMPTQYTWRSNCEQREMRGGEGGSTGQMSVTHFACGCGWPSTSLLGLQPPIHPSLLTSLSGCQRFFSTRRQLLAGDRASLVPWQYAGWPLPLVHLKGAQTGLETFSTHLWERSGLSFSMATSPCLCLKDSVTVWPRQLGFCRYGSNSEQQLGIVQKLS